MTLMIRKMDASLNMFIMIVITVSIIMIKRTVMILIVTAVIMITNYENN